MKKIILDCDLMKHRNTGLYYYCQDIGNYIQRELEKEGKEKLMFYVPDEGISFNGNKTSIIEKKWHNRYFKPFLFNCDIWHAPFQSGRIVKRYNKKMKVILTIHDLNVLHEGKPKKERKESLLRTQKLIDNSDAIICISNHTKNDVLHNLNVSMKPVYVIHNGTPDVAVQIPSKPARYVPLWPFIFTIGYVNKKKNFHSLLALLGNPELELIIAGKLDDPEYARNLFIKAKRLGVEERVHLLGPISDDDKAWYYKHCTAFSLPSLAEGFGTPVVEAMKFGKPIFLSNRTSLPEVGGDVCFYFSNFDKDHMLKTFNKGLKEFEEKEYREKVINRGIQFNWEEKAKEYINVYRTLL